MKTRLIFVRHAEAEGNARRLFHGWTDSEITEKGHLQAQRVAERLKAVDIDILYSSSLKRTLQTAGYISKMKDLPIIRTDKLKEINGGDWENQRWETLPQRWPHEYDTWENKPHIHRMPNGETMEQCQERVVGEVLHILNQNRGKNICIVSHGTAIRALQCYFHECELEEIIHIPWQDNTAVTIVDYEGGKFHMITEGDASHLSDDLGTVEDQEWWNEYKIKTEKLLEKKKREKDSRKRLVRWLFETDAIRVCSPAQPFWYTSGTIGPYYVNTHFLYGSEEKAMELLEAIDREKANILSCPGEILQMTLENYGKDPVYRGVMDVLCARIREEAALEEVDIISGGERRDWFFSLMAARILEKPHLTIYKDLSAVLSQDGVTKEMSDLKGKKVLHIADLITEASSYERAWIPAIKNRNGSLCWSFAVVDRKQGGAQYLESQGIQPFAMVSIDRSLFGEALSLDIIGEEQHRMILRYLENPRESMREFLKEHPEFLERALESGGKTGDRARLCIEKDMYHLKGT